jgi:protein ImuB
MYATLLLPCFRLQSALRFAPTPLQAKPLALLHSQNGRSVILESSEQALQQGVCKGISPAQALARCPDLNILPACPDSEQNTQEALLQVAWKLSPKVESPHPGLCTADLRRCRQDPKQMLLEAIQTLESLHLRARAGLAPVPDLALLAAHQARPLLYVENGAAFAASLPLSILTRDPTLLSTLARWGISTADALLKLPRQEVLERLGPSGSTLWEAARGGGDRPLRWIQEPVVFEESLSFEQEIEILEPLLFVLNRLLESLLRRMRCTSRLTARLKLELFLENRSTYCRSFTVPAPTLDSSVLLGILETHLEQLRIEHRAVGVRLRLETTDEKTCELDLFEPVLRNPNRFGETLGRLSALLGEDRIGIPLPSNCHFADHVRLGASSAFYKGGGIPAAGQAKPLRGLPLYRLRPAPPARVDFMHLKPVHIASQAVSGTIIGSRGPYRLSGNWWDSTSRSMEEWDIFVRLQQGIQRGLALARIGTPSPPEQGGVPNTAEWRLEGFYSTPEASRKIPASSFSIEN